jgi:hypothetical protein
VTRNQDFRIFADLAGLSLFYFDHLWHIPLAGTKQLTPPLPTYLAYRAKMTKAEASKSIVKHKCVLEREPSRFRS